MDDNLSDDEIVNEFNNPMSSELDRPGAEHEFGWISSECDDTDEDPDFLPSGDSLSESEGENDDIPINVNSVNNDSNCDNLTENSDVMSIDGSESQGNDSVAHDNGLLGEIYKKLKTKQEKDNMRKEVEGKWTLYEGRQQQFNFSGQPMYHFTLPKTAQPIEYFKKYCNDELLQLMVRETNRNATQVLNKIRLNRSSRLRAWQPTNIDEMNKFIGLLLWMGLHPLPRISDYWSTKVIYKNNVAPKVMSRNRFQLILRFWHFNNNDTLQQDGRLGKIAPLVSHLNNMFKLMKSPDEEMVIDESMVPFRGRLVFKQYIPMKTHKYGIKLFKICDTSGYTYGIIVYMGKGTGTNEGMSLPTSVVMDLMTDYFDKGHTLYLDNYYTSMDLATLLLQRSTHMVGTVRSNCAWIPHHKNYPEGNDKPLAKGEMVCLEYPNGLVYTRWMDKREVRLLSTKHPVEFAATGKNTRQGEQIMKPLVVVKYNNAKIGIDLSDQMSSYSTPVRKTMRWYHKVAEELLLGTALVNAWLAYKQNVGNNAATKKYKLSITTFKEKVVYDLLGLRDDVIDPVKKTGHHYLSESDTFVGEGKNKRRLRKYCKVCYQKLVGTEGRAKAKNLKKVTTLCGMCPNMPYLCKLCFQDIHK